MSKKITVKDIEKAYKEVLENRTKEEKEFNNDYPKGDCTQLACTHQMACAWIRKKGWHISVELSYDDNYNAV